MFGRHHTLYEDVRLSRGPCAAFSGAAATCTQCVSSEREEVLGNSAVLISIGVSGGWPDVAASTKAGSSEEILFVERCTRWKLYPTS